MQNLSWTRSDELRSEWYQDGVKFSDSYSGASKDSYERAHTGFGSGDFTTPTAGSAGTALVVYPHGVIEQHNGSGTTLVRSGSFSGFLGLPFGGVPDFVDARSYNAALTKLYDKLYQTELNLAVSIGEARESASMIKKGVQALGRVIATARQARRKLLTNPSLLISEAWLGLKYGWIPAMTDVYNMLHHETVRLREVQVKARAAWRSEVDFELLGGGLWPWHVTGYHSQRCEVAVWVAPLDQTAFDVARISSLNPLTVAWELLPLSFVADWFIDIGGYLQNMERSFGIGLSFKKGYVTRQRKSEQIGEIRPFFTSPWTVNPKVHSLQINTHKVRSVLADFPRPALPRFNINLGSQRVMSAAALIRTILLGKVK